MIAFDNSYARLPDRFRARLDPVPVAAPSMIAWNAALADEMGLPDLSNRPDIWSGNAIPEGAEPVAQAYAGHQFGGFVAQLGDGRALLLGEVESGGLRYDIQLKGSGPTPFSRRGDGRAWLGPVLREYVVSEAMHALGIPTTRALAAVRTGETVMRERPLPGAVLTRVAPSHLRVGTFEYFAARRDEEALLTLTDLAIARHHPGAEGPEGLLAAAIAAQAKLVAAWMSVGFVHGVMNTDNAHVGGITIDYGPCAFLDRYHPATVFSSIDRQGRYAYASQPQMAVWNMAQLANALLPIMGGEAAVEEVTGIVRGFADIYQAEWLRLFGRKVGIEAAGEADADLIHDLLDRMAAGGADFTNAFRALAGGDPAPAFEQPEALEGWTDRWRERVASETDPESVMARANPAVIPRNHRIEAMIEAAAAGDMGPFERLMAALADPYAPDAELALPPAPGEVVTATFCGT